MGLDGVELVMEIEDRFSTSVSDAAAERIQTVGDLHAFLMNRIRRQNSECCSSAALFYPIRKLLVTEFGIERNAVAPSTHLESLIAADDRYEFWRKLETSVATRLPRLKRSQWLQWNGDTFPDSCKTVAQLICHCVDVSKITDEFGPDDSNDVWDVVCKLVAEMAGVEKSVLEPETSFVNDLWF